MVHVQAVPLLQRSNGAIDKARSVPAILVAAVGIAVLLMDNSVTSINLGSDLGRHRSRYRYSSSTVPRLTISVLHRCIDENNLNLLWRLVPSHIGAPYVCQSSNQACSREQQ